MSLPLPIYFFNSTINTSFMNRTEALWPGLGVLNTEQLHTQ